MIAPEAPSNFNSVPILFSAKADAPLGKTLTEFDITHRKPDSNKTTTGKYRHRVDLVYGPLTTVHTMRELMMCFRLPSSNPFLFGLNFTRLQHPLSVAVLSI